MTILKCVTLLLSSAGVLDGGPDIRAENVGAGESMEVYCQLVNMNHITKLFAELDL